MHNSAFQEAPRLVARLSVGTHMKPEKFNLSLNISKSTETKSSGRLVFHQRDNQQPVNGDRLRDLPTEVLLKIFAHLDTGAALCLALASPRLYQVYKRENPKTPSLWGRAEFRSRHTHWPGYELPSYPLGALLEDWMGSEYRPLCVGWGWHPHIEESKAWRNPPFFLKKSIYGKKEMARQDEKVLERYHDYWKLKSKGVRLLPHPKDLGRGWEELCKIAMLRDAVRFEQFDDWGDFWSSSVPARFGDLNRMQKLMVWEGFEERNRMGEGYLSSGQKGWEKRLLRYKRFLKLTALPIDSFYL